MAEPLVLTFDVGTQSMRVLLISKTGEIIAKENTVYPNPYYSVYPGWAEQDPDYYYQVLCDLAKRLKEKQPEKFSKVSAIAITTIRDTVICLDKEGNPLRPAILWLDQRKVKKLIKIPFIKNLVINLAGMRATSEMMRRVSACNWIAENEPGIWQKTDKYVLLSTYLNFKLTGKLIDSAANMVAHMPFDHKHRVWDKNGLAREFYDIPQEKLCDLLPSGTVVGGITKKAGEDSGIPEGLPLIATGTDKACETIGLSVLHQNQAAISFGTSATIQISSPKFFEPIRYIPAYTAVPNNLYNGEIQLFRGYWLLSWFRKNFAQSECEEAERLGCTAEELLNKHLDDIPAGCDGLLILPHWAPGLDTPEARGAMVGFSDVHTKYHIYRALIEGINYGLMDGLYKMEKASRQKITCLYAGGGGSRSEEILQITADMFGLPVKRVQTYESCSLGCAMCAYVALGEFKDYDEAAESMVHIVQSYEPDMKKNAFYQKIYKEVYSKYYKTELPLHKKLTVLTEDTAR